jgi:hypothetical protein
VLEVTPAGDIVWQFVNPVRGGEQNDQIPIICWAQRLDPDALDPTLLTNRSEQGPPRSAAATR